tara:strand:+ start:694 stop:918 length:225 start_codon:yes stop_codon:yes gene_type:complete
MKTRLNIVTEGGAIQYIQLQEDQYNVRDVEVNLIDWDNEKSSPIVVRNYPLDIVNEEDFEGTLNRADAEDKLKD